MSQDLGWAGCAYAEWPEFEFMFELPGWEAIAEWDGRAETWKPVGEAILKLWGNGSPRQIYERAEAEVDAWLN